MTSPKSTHFQLHLLHLIILAFSGFVVFPLVLHLNYLNRLNLLQEQIAQFSKEYSSLQEDKLRHLELKRDLKNLEFQVETLKLQSKQGEHRFEKWKQQQRNERKLLRDLSRQSFEVSDHIRRLEYAVNQLSQKMLERLSSLKYSRNNSFGWSHFTQGLKLSFSSFLEKLTKKRTPVPVENK
jgi:chromosome segregation ATPase